MNAAVTPNLCRDGNWLVVPIENAVFPNRCIKTNQPVESPTYLFVTDLLWQQVQVPESGGQQAANAAAKALFGGVGGAVLDLARKRRLKYQIGLSEEYQVKAKKRFRWGLALVVLGPILSVVLGTILGVLTQSIFGHPIVPLILGGFALGFIMMLVGIILFAISSMGILQVKRSDGRSVWFDGANREFLATLPESPEKWTPLFKKLFK